MGDTPLRILVADDDPDILHDVAAVLEERGATVTRAATGAELIAHLGEGPAFDLVVTDVAMPWMTGLQAMHATRYAGLATPVIVMTALRDEAIPAQVEALGGHALLLRKPFGLAELERAVAKLIPVMAEHRAAS
jgi:CheY-like chemotaxis protein